MARFEEEAREFLKICGEFQLGNLPTESPNPKTIGLSDLVESNLSDAILTLLNIDRDVFKLVREKKVEIYNLKKQIIKVLNAGGNIYLVGCGATGRLSLALETLWRMKFSHDEKLKDRVISFMAGGDVALIHSVEKFEDFPEYGERQMMELNFSKNDFLIATTEGGETPFVIGATEKAAELSKYHPYFLYCNPDEILTKTTKRSRDVINNSKINKINLTVGPMALTGSTRMQATTVLMFVVGLALLNVNSSNEIIDNEIDAIISYVENLDLSFLKDFIVKESEIYKNNDYILYSTDGDLGITILTDTTERSPTFSLYPFENQLDSEKNPAWSYLYFPQSINSNAAWLDLLKRSPRAFFWEEVTDRTSIQRLVGFNFSSELLQLRKSYIHSQQKIFKINFEKETNHISFELDGIVKKLNLNQLSFLSAHMILKIILNNHSTLVMGKMGRYKSNLMTFVRASNFKLIDRSVRYAKILLAEKDIQVSYEDLVICCFKYKDEISRDHSLVLKMVEEFSSKT
jgi:N-acetylmuramic acid 6-phosphate etherase